MEVPEREREKKKRTWKEDSTKEIQENFPELKDFVSWNNVCIYNWKEKKI